MTLDWKLTHAQDTVIKIYVKSCKGVEISAFENVKHKPQQFFILQFSASTIHVSGVLDLVPITANITVAKFVFTGKVYLNILTLNRHLIY